MADKVGAMKIRNYYFEQYHLKGYERIEDEIRNFSNCKRILDVGCGTAWLCKVLREAYPDAVVFGIDISNAIEFKDFHYVIATCLKLPFESGAFDGVFCKAVLEHLHDPLGAVMEINRVLKKGGVLFVSVPELKDKHFWDDYTHIRPYNRKSILTMLKDGGFEISEWWYLSSIPGAGRLMKILTIRNQRLLKFFGRIGFLRSTINVIVNKK